MVDIETTFWNVDLDENRYMDQPKWFIESEKENKNVLNSLIYS